MSRDLHGRRQVAGVDRTAHVRELDPAELADVVGGRTGQRPPQMPKADDRRPQAKGTSGGGFWRWLLG